MAAIANNPAFAKKAGIPQSVGSDFVKADKGHKFSKGGDTMATKGVNPFAKFEKSGKDVEKKGMKEGSKADMMMDKKQMMKPKKMAEGGAMSETGTGQKMPAPAYGVPGINAPGTSVPGTNAQVIDKGKVPNAPYSKVNGNIPNDIPSRAPARSAPMAGSQRPGSQLQQVLANQAARRNIPASAVPSPVPSGGYGRAPAMMNKGGGVMKYAKGGSIDGIAQRGKTKGTMITMKKGGKC